MFWWLMKKYILDCELVGWPLICRDLYQHRWMGGPDALVMFQKLCLLNKQHCVPIGPLLKMYDLSQSSYLQTIMLCVIMKSGYSLFVPMPMFGICIQYWWKSLGLCIVSRLVGLLVISDKKKQHCMMTSSNGNISSITGHLCREFTGHQWIPWTKASDGELWCFLWSAPE